MAVSDHSLFHDNKSSDLALFLLQAMLIFIITRCFSYLFRYLNQPAVLAEIVGGVIIGPTVLCRIESFKYYLFPDTSLWALKLLGDFGLTLLYLLMFNCLACS
jgi:Kef-type K+ transport system membrane component KefB